MCMFLKLDLRSSYILAVPNARTAYQENYILPGTRIQTQEFMVVPYGMTGAT